MKPFIFVFYTSISHSYLYLKNIAIKHFIILWKNYLSFQSFVEKKKE